MNTHTAHQGRFIVVEGIDGSGKSTQATLLAEHLRTSGAAVLHTREPGGTPAAEAIRALLLDGAATQRLPLTDVLLMSAARYEHVQQAIKPALAEGTTVICDRFRDSTYAYQCAGQSAESAATLAIQDIVCGDCVPDDVIIMDIPPEEAFRRLRASGKGGGKDETYYERLGLDFYARVRAGFLERASTADKHTRYHLIDATQPADAIAEQISNFFSL